MSREKEIARVPGKPAQLYDRVLNDVVNLLALKK
jgi:hypothetical protein